MLKIAFMINHHSLTNSLNRLDRENTDFQNQMNRNSRYDDQSRSAKSFTSKLFSLIEKKRRFLTFSRQASTLVDSAFSKTNQKGISIRFTKWNYMRMCMLSKQCISSVENAFSDWNSIMNNKCIQAIKMWNERESHWRETAKCCCLDLFMFGMRAPTECFEYERWEKKSEF